MNKLTRREFLNLISIAATGMALGAGCAPQAPTPVPTALPAPTKAPVVPTATAAPTNTPIPQATPTIATVPLSSIRRPAIIKMYPDVPSTVVHTSHAGVWADKKLVPAAVRQMLDASITKLTGLTDAKKAWQALFQPNERIAIKVNAFSNSLIWTHVPLVTAVTQSLVDAGIPPEQIVVFDFTTEELKTAGFTINPDGPGVRCYGTDSKYAKKIALSKFANPGFSDILFQSDAIINMPILKSHMLSGFTFALKNHYGSVNSPESLHFFDDSLPALNALPDIKDRTRLIVGDILEACLNHTASWPYWKSDFVGDSILMSFDPLAHDRVGLNLFTKYKTDKGGNTDANLSMSQSWMENCGKAGLGANDVKDIKLEEIALK